MSSCSSSYEDFLKLPGRVFLDSSVLNNIYEYGHVLFGVRSWDVRLASTSGKKALQRSRR